MNWFPSSATGLPAMTVLIVAFGLFVGTLLLARRRTGRQPKDGKRDRASLVGIIVQSFGIFVTAFGPVLVSLDPAGPPALAEAAVVMLLMAGRSGCSTARRRRWARTGRSSPRLATTTNW